MRRVTGTMRPASAGARRGISRNGTCVTAPAGSEGMAISVGSQSSPASTRAVTPRAGASVRLSTARPTKRSSRSPTARSGAVRSAVLR
nr:hypothetical protein [Deltaproteobacteria bacterium]